MGHKKRSFKPLNCLESLVSKSKMPPTAFDYLYSEFKDSCNLDSILAHTIFQKNTVLLKHILEHHYKHQSIGLVPVFDFLQMKQELIHVLILAIKLPRKESKSEQTKVEIITILTPFVNWKNMMVAGDIQTNHKLQPLLLVPMDAHENSIFHILFNQNFSVENLKMITRCFMQYMPENLNFSTLENKYGMTILDSTLMNFDVSLGHLKFVIEKFKCDIHRLNKNGQTPLYTCVKYVSKLGGFITTDQFLCITELINLGSNITIGYKGYSILDYMFRAIIHSAKYINYTPEQALTMCKEWKNMGLKLSMKTLKKYSNYSLTIYSDIGTTSCSKLIKSLQ